MQHDLDLPQDSFRLMRIGENDARERTDDFYSLRDLILQSEPAYPQIGRWFDGRVLQGLRTGQRTGYVGLINERPVAAAVVKRGQVAKFCHLKIDPAAKSRSLGDLFFTLMTLDVRHQAERVRFTLPESVWEDRRSFFNSFSFNAAEKCGRQYRLFESELFSETSFASLFGASRDKLPRLMGQLAIADHSLLTGAVLAVQPAPLEKIFSGQKTVEIRTRFSARWEKQRISLYGTHPISGLAGEANISRVIGGHPDRIWEHFGPQIGCSRAQFDAYTGDREHIFAVVLADVRAFVDPVPLAQLSHLLGVHLTAPQSYASLANSDGWLSAVVLAAALQGSIGVRKKSVAVNALPTRGHIEAPRVWSRG
jgi:predicted transcriptional regulator